MVRGTEGPEKDWSGHDGRGAGGGGYAGTGLRRIEHATRDAGDWDEGLHESYGSTRWVRGERRVGCAVGRYWLWSWTRSGRTRKDAVRWRDDLRGAFAGGEQTENEDVRLRTAASKSA